MEQCNAQLCKRWILFFFETIPVFISKWATLPSLMSNSFCLSNKQSRPSVCAETVFTVFSLFCFRAGTESVFKMEYGRLCFRCLWKDTRIYDEEGALLETTGLAAVGMLLKNQPTRSCFLERLAHSETKFHFVPTAIEWCLTNRKVHSIFQLSVAAIFDPNCNGFIMKIMWKSYFSLLKTKQTIRHKFADANGKPIVCDQFFFIRNPNVKLK